METVVRAPDTAGGMRALLDRLGPQAVLLGTRRVADGVELTGASGPATTDRGAVARFRRQAAALGFDERTLAPVADTAGPGASAADLWVRFVTRIERQVTIAPPPHETAPAIGIVGPQSGRLALFDALAALMALDDPILVATAEWAPLVDLAARRRLSLVRPDMRWGIAGIARPGARLLIDLGEASAVPPAIEAQARGIVRVGVVDAEPVDGPLTGRCDALALVGADVRPGIGISGLLLHALPLAYLAAPTGNAIQPARGSLLCQQIVAALARLTAAGS